jgi:hypothetical protein
MALEAMAMNELSTRNSAKRHIEQKAVELEITEERKMLKSKENKI